MDAVRNEDRLCRDTVIGARYNLIENIEAEETGSVVEPVSLAEMKSYLRLEGFSNYATAGIDIQAPLTLILLAGLFSVQSNVLIGATIITLAREGTTYTGTTGTPGNRQYVHNTVTGTITFLFAGEAGNEVIDIAYGTATTDFAQADEFDFDDTLIQDLINEGRVWAERYTGLHLVPKTLTVVLLNQAGMIELPGPVTGTISIKDKEGNVIPSTGYKFIGVKFPLLETKFDDRITLEYAAGYAACPDGLKNAIKAYVAEHYEHRGDEQPDKALTERAARKARAYRRLTLWA